VHENDISLFKLSRGTPHLHTSEETLIWILNYTIPKS